MAPFGSSDAFRTRAGRSRFACRVLDIGMPGMDGLALQERLKSDRFDVPVIFITGSSDLLLAVRGGAREFLQKPGQGGALYESDESVAQAIETGRLSASDRARQEDVVQRLSCRTDRKRQVMERVRLGG